MKNRFLVGALGLALAAGAYAQRGTAPNAASLDGATNADNTKPQTYEEFAKARDNALGLPGSAQRQSVLEQMGRAIRRGEYSARQAIIGSFGINQKSDYDFKHGANIYTGKRTQGAIVDYGAGGARAHGGPSIDTPPFEYFDGFETYQRDTTPDAEPFMPLLTGQIQPDGDPINTFGWPSTIVASPGETAVTGLANANHRNPYAPASAPGDPDPLVNQSLAHMRGIQTGGANAGFFFNTILRNPFVNASPGIPLIQSIDWYFPDLQTFYWVDGRGPGNTDPGGGSFTLGRWFMGGFDFGGTFAAFLDPDNVARTPIILGSLPNVFGFGQFFAPPKTPKNSAGVASGLAQFKIGTNEWISTAIRISVDAQSPPGATPPFPAGTDPASGLSQWMRQGSTDGTGVAGTTIIDPRLVPGFETGWAEIYPGQAANAGVPGVFEGVGRSVNDFGQEATQPAPILSQVLTGSMRMINGGDPLAQMPAFVPTNFLMDNYTLLGNLFATPPQPKQRMPYLDDMELYTPNNVLFLQGGTWNDTLAGLSKIVLGNNTTPPPGSDGDGAPNQSLNQTNVLIDSFWRQLFSTTVPGANATSSFDLLNRPLATPGMPLDINMQVRLEFPTTTRGIQVNDGAFSGTVAGELVLRNHDFLGTIIDKAYARLPNPLFDQTVSEDVMEADQEQANPTLAGNNTRSLNFPYTDAIPLGVFFRAGLKLFGDGTAEWSINSNALTFDPTFLALDPKLDAFIAGANTGAARTRFPTSASTLSNVAFFSGGNTGGLNDDIWIDDFRIDGKVRVVGAGPDFWLPYWDDLEGYVANGSEISGQGTTNFLDGSTINDNNLAIHPGQVQGTNCRNLIPNVFEDATRINFRKSALDPAAAVTDYCLYTVLTDTGVHPFKTNNPAAALPGDCPVVADVVALRVWPTYTCPTATNWDCSVADPAGFGEVLATSGTMGAGARADAVTILTATYFGNIIQGFDGPAPGTFLPERAYAPATYCAYRINTIFPGKVNDWCIENNDLVYVKLGKGCEVPDAWPGIVNMFLFPDTSNGAALNPNLRGNCPVNATFLGQVTDNAFCADYITNATRNIADDPLGPDGLVNTGDEDRHVFCHYNIDTAPVGLPNPAAGGTPFTCPAWTIGTVIAIDQVLAFNADNNSICPGIIPAGAPLAPVPALFEIWDKDNCPTCSGMWDLLSLGMDTAAPPNVVGAADALNPLAVKGYEFVTLTLPRWQNGVGGRGDDTLMFNLFTDGIMNQNGTVATADDTPIDPAGLFNQAICFGNNGNLPDVSDGGVEYTDLTSILPTAQAVATGVPGTNIQLAALYFDVYCTDNNSRFGVGASGLGGEVTRVRMGGPDATSDPLNLNGVGVAADRVGVLITNTMSGFPAPVTNIYMDPAAPPTGATVTGTGFTLVPGNWYRFCIQVDGLGAWTLGINTTGAPGNMVNDSDPLTFTQIATGGTSVDTDDRVPNGTGLAVNSIDGINTFQGFDEAGIGTDTFGDVPLVAFGPAAVPNSAMFGPFSYCFYEVNGIDPTDPVLNPGPVPQVNEIDSQTGLLAVDALAVPIVRDLAGGDMVAVQFTNPGPFNVNCPIDPGPAGSLLQGRFAFQNAGTGALETIGDWQLRGSEGEIGLVFDEPKGGINTTGPSAGVGYNAPSLADPGEFFTILLGDFITPLPTIQPTVRSHWYIDNIHIQEIVTGVVPNPCPWDLDGNGSVGASDLATLIGFWGLPGAPDFDASGTVGAADLATLIGNWGPCP